MFGSLFPAHAARIRVNPFHIFSIDRIPYGIVLKLTLREKFGNVKINIRF
jgi:hypothetical protein